MDLSTAVVWRLKPFSTARLFNTAGPAVPHRRVDRRGPTDLMVSNDVLQSGQTEYKNHFMMYFELFFSYYHFM